MSFPFLLCLSTLRFLGLSESEKDFPIVLDPIPKLVIFFEKVLHVLASLAEAFAFVREPRTAFFDDVVVRRDIDEIAFAWDAFAVHDVEFRVAKRRCAFVLDDLHTRPVSDDAIAILDRTNTPNIKPEAHIELKSFSRGWRFR